MLPFGYARMAQVVGVCRHSTMVRWHGHWESGRLPPFRYAQMAQALEEWEGAAILLLANVRWIGTIWWGLTLVEQIGPVSRVWMHYDGAPSNRDRMAQLVIRLSWRSHLSCPRVCLVHVLNFRCQHQERIISRTAVLWRRYYLAINPHIGNSASGVRLDGRGTAPFEYGKIARVTAPFQCGQIQLENGTLASQEI